MHKALLALSITLAISACDSDSTTALTSTQKTPNTTTDTDPSTTAASDSANSGSGSTTSAPPSPPVLTTGSVQAPEQSGESDSSSTEWKNKAPSFTLPNELSVSAGETVSLANFAKQISDNDGGKQALSFQVQTDNPSLFTQQPEISIPSGTLRFKTGKQTGQAVITVSLHDDGGRANGGQDSSAAQRLTITITAAKVVNQAPSFSHQGPISVQTNSVISLDGWASELNDGDEDATQALRFELKAKDPQLFTKLPELSVPSGTLRFKTGELAGETALSITLVDNGGTEHGGKDRSKTVTVPLTITQPTPLNAPSFSHQGDVTVEANSIVSIDRWASQIDDNDPGKQALWFVVENNANPDLFSQAPEISYPSGTLRFATIGREKGGEARITVYLRDDGDIKNGGKNRSESISFLITAKPIDDGPENTAPSLSLEPVSVKQGESVRLTLQGQDAEGDSLSYRLLQPASHGVALIQGNELLYTPNADFSGEESLQVIANDGELDSAVARVLIQVEAVQTAKVASGNHHTYYTNEQGQLLSVGENSECSVRRGPGQDVREANLGRGSDPYLLDPSAGDFACNRAQFNPVPGLVQGLDGLNIRQLVSGQNDGAVITDQGELYMWGRNDRGQSGQGHTDPIARATLVALPEAVVDVSIGGAHTVAATRSGQVYTWGAYNNGILGQGDTIVEQRQNQLTPTAITLPDGAGKAVSVAAEANRSTLVLTDQGKVFVFGSNTQGQAGQGSKDVRNYNTAVEVQGFGEASIKKIFAGSSNLFALDEQGQLWGWGDGSKGHFGLLTETGAPDKTDLLQATRLTGLNDDIGEAIADFAAGSRHAGVVTESGKLLLWGWHTYLAGNLGLGQPTIYASDEAARPFGIADTSAVGNYYPSPQQPDEAKDQRFSDLNILTNNSYAVSETGQIFGWGQTANGRLGRGLKSCDKSINSRGGEAFLCYRPRVMPTSTDPNDIELADTAS